MLQQSSSSQAELPSGANNMTGNASAYSQQYCLRWKYHHSNLQTMFSLLLERQAYCDVTLACEGKSLKAHKVVLSACSTYFDTLLSQYEEKDTTIVMIQDVKFSDIKALVEFMYKGEINIDHSRLSSLLKTAEDLHIKGLAEVSWRNDAGINELTNSGHHSPGSGGTPGVETVLREGTEEPEHPTPPKQRRRGRPPLDDTPSVHDVFTPKLPSLSGQVDETSEGDQSWDDDVVPEHENTMPIITCIADQEKKSRENSNFMVPEQFRDVIKMNEYLTTGRRQEFWEEPFTRRVMDAIKSKELEMKTAAEILGVSYGTLYGRYRDSYGCLKHPYRVRDFWSEPGPADILAKLKRKEITLFRAAEFLNVTVHTLATYLSTLQGPDRITLAGDLTVAATGTVTPVDMLTSSNEFDTSDCSVNDILQKMQNTNTSSAAAPTTSTAIKREGGGYVEVPAVGLVPKAASSVLENNPDITIVKAETIQRKRPDYTKITATENNNAKLMSGGAVSKLTQSQIIHPAVVQHSQQQTIAPQQMITAQTTVQQQLQQMQVQHHKQMSDTLSINNDICKP
ncbi:uncharacterized protein LOC106657979 [Trichogramma pretiosum]|uniref:uncharacterized protein LOC106657979 n=1 Tax=Trichogramma pretiosum TaxID=7493 RepID=UPI0006C99CCC|nr:uncharacterized protein LOC106657979 [Trichogramma pretiosum]XP_014235208.1 uncharacterized protein LOC106657979 [Trichogramma pretiosum]